METDTPDLPVAISAIDDKYLLFDIQAISWLRKHHNICGVFVGTLPQNPSQNVFMGLPMEIMPEEAQLLIDQGVAYILDDAKAHDAALASVNKSRQAEYIKHFDDQATEISAAKAIEKEAEKKRALKKIKAKKAQTQSTDSSTMEPSSDTVVSQSDAGEDQRPEALFTDQDDTGISDPTASKPQPVTAMSITPTTSSLLLPLPPSPTLQSSAPSARRRHRQQSLLPGLSPASYALYEHLHSAPRSFFMTPGLRFGCQFCVYPGDPLRFHSHFLAVGIGWEDEIDLMDVVSGGRLGTGVKKGWLFGGREEGMGAGDASGGMRTFSVEWAAM